MPSRASRSALCRTFYCLAISLSTAWLKRIIPIWWRHPTRNAGHSVGDNRVSRETTWGISRQAGSIPRKSLGASSPHKKASRYAGPKWGILFVTARHPKQEPGQGESIPRRLWGVLLKTTRRLRLTFELAHLGLQSRVLRHACGVSQS